MDSFRSEKIKVKKYGLITKYYYAEELPLTVINDPRTGEICIGTNNYGFVVRESVESFGSLTAAKEALMLGSWTTRNRMEFSFLDGEDTKPGYDSTLAEEVNEYELDLSDI